MRRFYAILSILSTLPAQAAVNLSFDSVSVSGSQNYDPDYDLTTNTGSNYTADYTDSTAGVTVRFTQIDILGSRGDKPDGAIAYTLEGDNADFGIRADNDGTSTGDGTDELSTSTDPDRFLQSHFRLEFLDSTTETALANDDYRLTFYDLDYKIGNRIESILFPNSSIGGVERFDSDGFLTTTEYSGTLGVTDPDVNGTLVSGVTYVQEGKYNGSFNGTNFTSYSGSANFDTNESATNSTPASTLSIVLSGVNSFEFIAQMRPNSDEDRRGMGIELDFSDPADNPSIVPEPSSYAMLVALLGLTFAVSARRSNRR